MLEKNINVNENRPKCPECGYPLSVTLAIDKESQDIIIDIWCEGPRNDEFWLRISTELSESDLDFLDKGETHMIEIKLMDRESDN